MCSCYQHGDGCGGIKSGECDYRGDRETPAWSREKADPRELRPVPRNRQRLRRSLTVKVRPI